MHPERNSGRYRLGEILVTKGVFLLVGYASDEHYVAIPDCVVEFDRGGEFVTATRSLASGAIHVELSPGSYRVTLAKDGFGSKRSKIEIGGNIPHQFRLLSDRLIGYAWPKWVRSGEFGDFRVHSVEPFRLSLWRYGQKREFVRLLGWHDEHGPRAMAQILPDGDFTQRGTDWNKQGYTNPHINQLIAAPERSGLYYFHAETESGRFFSFPWVVAPAKPQAKIAVLAATNNWNAYNNWGGRSNYVNASGLPPQPTVNARQDLPRYTKGPFTEWLPHDEEFLPLSFARPEPGNCVARDEEATDACRGRLQSSLAPGEWRLLAWLEREGFTYDLYAEAQLDSGLVDLDAYDILIFGVHPEYWSHEMYRRVKLWVFERGGRLLYLGGNGVNCEVEYPDASTMRTKSHLKSDNGTFSMASPDDPAARFESRFHRTVECEANLLGVVSTETGIMTGAPYRVIRANHWVFTGTGLNEGDEFGHESLHERCPGGASGYETDKISSHSPPETVLLAKGLNPENGGAEMVCCELANGGAIFSAGSITWCLSLLPDPAVSRITANAIHRFAK